MVTTKTPKFWRKIIRCYKLATIPKPSISTTVTTSRDSHWVSVNYQIPIIAKTLNKSKFLHESKKPSENALWSLSCVPKGKSLKLPHNGEKSSGIVFELNLHHQITTIITANRVPDYRAWRVLLEPILLCFLKLGMNGLPSSSKTWLKNKNKIDFYAKMYWCVHRYPNTVWQLSGFRERP